MNIGFEAKRVFHNKTGLGNYSRDLVRILAEHFPENNYFLYNPKVAKESLFIPNDITVFERKPRTSFYRKFKNLWRQKGVVSDLEKDKIHLFHGLSGEIPVGLRKKNIKSIVTIHDLIFIRYPHLYSFFDRKIHFYKFQKSAQNADLVIAISEQTKSDIVNFLHINPDKIHVIYQGCNDAFKKTYTDSQKDIVAKKFNLPEQFILNVGTIEERKNALTIVKAIKDLEVNLVLIGKETAYANQIHDYINANDLQNRVHFLKGISTEELAIIYQLATVFVYPSVFEGFGIPIIEALYSKTPVITNKFGVFPEAGGPDSLYVNPNDILELSEKIKLIITNKTLAKEITEKGLKFVQQFNDKHIAKSLQKLYENINNY